jgi:hypothetical protein
MGLILVASFEQLWPESLLYFPFSGKLLDIQIKYVPVKNKHSLSDCSGTDTDPNADCRKHHSFERENKIKLSDATGN